MATFQHPASLNPLQQFRQACAILSTTTRASNPAWYQEALELNFQLHIRPDGLRINAFYYDLKQDQWSAGPVLSEEIIGDPDKLDAVIADVLSQTRSKGASALGVILHVADEFATTELKPEYDNPSAINDLRDAAVNDPASILEDSSANAAQSSWRLLPYPAAGSEVIGTTVVLSRKYEPLLEAFRQAGNAANFPIITHAFSAPLIAMMGLSHVLSPTPGKPFVAILQYNWFTVLAFFNESADLRLIRTLQHHGGSCPRFFRRNALSTTNAALEFDDPDIFILRLCEGSDPVLETNLRGTFPNSRIEMAHYPTTEGVPAWCQEPAISTHPADAAHLNDSNHPITTRHPLLLFRDEQWSSQDFFPIAREALEIYPQRSEMRMLRILRLARVGLFSVTVLGLAYLGMGVLDLTRRPAWKLNEEDASATQSRLAQLTAVRQKMDHWNNLLADRSKGWVAMEALARMFPENGGMLLKNYYHSSKPEVTQGQTKVGFVKEWKINGYARDEALDYLNTLNTSDGINAYFAQVYKLTGNEAFNPQVGNRTINVNIRTQENNGFKPALTEEINVADETTYPFTFDLTITQRFEATDPLAITVPKSPK